MDFLPPTYDYCPFTGKRVHSYHDWGGWVEHKHPQCSLCGFVDESRTLDVRPPIQPAKREESK